MTDWIFNLNNGTGRKEISTPPAKGVSHHINMQELIDWNTSSIECTGYHPHKLETTSVEQSSTLRRPIQQLKEGKQQKELLQINGNTTMNRKLKATIPPVDNKKLTAGKRPRKAFDATSALTR